MYGDVYYIANLFCINVRKVATPLPSLCSEVHFLIFFLIISSSLYFLLRMLYKKPVPVDARSKT